MKKHIIACIFLFSGGALKAECVVMLVVQRAEPVPEMRPSRIRWIIEGRVIESYAKTGEVKPDVDDTVQFGIHSLIIDMGVDRDAIAGKCFWVKYQSPFMSPYYGKLDVSEASEAPVPTIGEVTRSDRVEPSGRRLGMIRRRK